MKPSYALLKGNHKSSDPFSSSYVAGPEIYSEIGYNYDTLIKQNPAYENTCAVRMSLALLKTGVIFTGRLPIKDGTLKGHSIESGAKLLADQLMRKDVFGKPELFKDASKASAKIGNRSGVVFFHKITGYGGGHIDLIDGLSAVQLCNSGCYFGAAEVWFWELK
jgi:hypothetical protein